MSAMSIFKLRLARLVAPYPTDETTAPQRRGMTMLWWDNILSSLSGAFYGDFEVLFLLALGATSSVVGARASIVSAVGFLAPLLGAWLVERSGKRKFWALLGGGGLGRAALLLMALVPFISQGQSALVALVVLAAIQSFVGAASGPAANSLFADVVPLPIRGRFIGAQMIASNLVRIAMIPLAGWMIKQIGGLEGYQVAIMIAAIVGFAATSVYARIPEAKTVEGLSHDLSRRSSFGEGLRLFLADKTFVLFCLINAIWNFGIQLCAPFFTMHMSQTLGFSVYTISMISTTTTVVHVLALRLIGGPADRRGSEYATALGMLLVPLMPIFWIFARTPFHVFLVQSYSFVAWAGFHVAATPLLLRLTPPGHRSQYIAIFSMINSIANALGPIPASWVYSHYGFTANLILSAIGRGLGGVLFLILLLRGGFRPKQ